MRRTAVTLLAAALLLGACTDDDPTLDPEASPDPTTTSEAEPAPTATTPTSTPAAAGEAEGSEAEGANTDDEVQLTAELTPDTEVPGPGRAAAGTMELREASGELCYELTASGISSEVVSAHINRGEAGEAGEIVIELQAPVDGSSSGCETVEAMDLVPLLEETSSFYVNVHSQDHPDGPWAAGTRLSPVEASNRGR